MPPALISDFMNTSHISQSLQHSWPSRDRTSSSRTSGSSDFMSTSHISQNLQHSCDSRDRTSSSLPLNELGPGDTKLLTQAYKTIQSYSHSVRCRGLESVDTKLVATHVGYATVVEIYFNMFSSAVFPYA